MTNEEFKQKLSKWWNRFKALLIIFLICLSLAWSPFVSFSNDDETIMITIDMFDYSITNLTTFK